MFTNRIFNGAIVLSLIAILPLVGFQAPAQANAPDIIVNTTSDMADFEGAQQVEDLPGPDGLVSLREAIIAANRTPGPQVIAFHIPTTDPGSDGSTFTIMPLATLPILSGGETTIDGSSQAEFTGDTNPFGPEIVINGSLITSTRWPWTQGLVIRSSDNWIHSLVVNGVPKTRPGDGSGIFIIADKSGGINASHNTVTGCYIGIDPTGSFAVPNGGGGIIVSEDATLNLIGGKTVVSRNVVSGNFQGIDIGGNDNIVQGNYLGTDASGTRTVGNQHCGVNIVVQASGNLIGGTEPGAGNLMSGNRTGLGLFDEATGNAVIGNLIGTDVTGQGPLGNRLEGVTIDQVASNNRIEANIVAYNDRGISAETGIGNTFTRNRIFSNESLGIDLANDFRVTPNDPGDADTGPNNLMNFPVLTSARTAAGRLIVRGTLDTPNPQSATIEFFANPVPAPGGDPSGHGEGAIYLGSARPNPQGKFAAILPPVPVGTLISATATDAEGNTSEFAQNIEATMLP